MILSEYGGTLREAREWLAEPALAVVRLLGCIKRRYAGDKAQPRQMPVTADSLKELEKAHEAFKRQKEGS